MLCHVQKDLQRLVFIRVSPCSRRGGPKSHVISYHFTFVWELRKRNLERAQITTTFYLAFIPFEYHIITLLQLQSLIMSETACYTEQASKTWKFWAIFAALAFTNLLAGLEGTITAATLPSIVSDLNSGENYVWIVNGYLLT